MRVPAIRRKIYRTIWAIDLGNGDLVVLHNVTMSQLSASDFIFATPAEPPPRPAAAAQPASGEFTAAADVAFGDDGLVRWLAEHHGGAVIAGAARDKRTAANLSFSACPV